METQPSQENNPQQILSELQRLANEIVVELNEAHFNAPLVESVQKNSIPQLQSALEKIIQCINSTPANQEKVSELESIIKDLGQIAVTVPKLKRDFTYPFDRIVKFRL